MSVKELLSAEWGEKAVWYVIGLLTTAIGVWIKGRRSTFTYFVNHTRVGESTNDPIFGNVQMSLNGTAVPNLYLSTVEVENQSGKDFKNVEVMLYTNDTLMLGQRTSIVDTPHSIKFTPAYQAEIHVEPEQRPTQAQFDTWNCRRQYQLPSFNRGQVAKFEILNSAKNVNQIPTIWLSINENGIRVVFRHHAERILGVPARQAMWAGFCFGGAVVMTSTYLVREPWQVVPLAFLMGVTAKRFGALVVRIWRKLRTWYVG